MEYWKEIPGYEGLYEVSSYGRVRSVDRYVKNGHSSYRLQKGRVLSPGKDKKGYLNVQLRNKNFKVHRLVAQAFIENSDNLPMVNHKDEDKTNNNVTNLEWCDAKYNNNYGSRKDKVRDTKIKNGYWTGLSKTKEYMKEYMKEYRKKNKEKIREKNREYMREYYDENKDKIREYMREYRKKRKNK